MYDMVETESRRFKMGKILYRRQRPLRKVSSNSLTSKRKYTTQVSVSPMAQHGYSSNTSHSVSHTQSSNLDWFDEPNDTYTSTVFILEIRI
jgi:hypothetical protein